MAHAQLKENLMDVLMRHAVDLRTWWLSSEVNISGAIPEGESNAKVGFTTRNTFYEECRRKK